LFDEKTQITDFDLPTTSRYKRDVKAKLILLIKLYNSLQRKQRRVLNQKGAVDVQFNNINN
jgi:hypothetical protein